MTRVQRRRRRFDSHQLLVGVKSFSYILLSKTVKLYLLCTSSLLVFFWLPTAHFD